MSKHGTGRVTLGWRQGAGEGERALGESLREAGVAPYGPGVRFMGRFPTTVKDGSESPDGNVDVNEDENGNGNGNGNGNDLA